jgi:hypothetical protein
LPPLYRPWPPASCLLCTDHELLPPLYRPWHPASSLKAMTPCLHIQAITSWFSLLAMTLLPPLYKLWPFSSLQAMTLQPSLYRQKSPTSSMHAITFCFLSSGHDPLTTLYRIWPPASSLQAMTSCLLSTGFPVQLFELFSVL